MQNTAYNPLNAFLENRYFLASALSLALLLIGIKTGSLLLLTVSGVIAYGRPLLYPLLYPLLQQQQESAPEQRVEDELEPILRTTALAIN